MTHPIPASAHPGVRAWHASLGLARRPTLTGSPGVWVDLSEFQTVDWNSLGQAYQDGAVAGVIMRASFGTARADRTFATNQREARARGIPGAFYHFCYPSVNSAAAEAAFFNATVGPLQPLEAMIGDFEDDGPNLFPRGAAGLQWAEAFLAALQTPVNVTWAYSYPSLISNVGLQPLWQTWPFWLADYSATPDSVFTYATIRQFTDCGSVPGVSGCCDQSRVLRAPMTQWLTPGGWLMALTDPQQQQLFDNVQALHDMYTTNGGGAGTSTGTVLDLLETTWNAAYRGDPNTAVGKVLAAVQTPPTVDVNALAAALATHPLTATLSDAERDAVAQHVMTAIRAQVDKA